MKQTLTWKKKTFSEDYQIYDGVKQIGYLKSSSFSQMSRGTINGKQFQFRTKGFFNQETTIVDGSTMQPIGQIRYNSWMSKAQITYGDKSISWQYTNAWNTKWTLSDEKGLRYFCQKKACGGSIGVNEEEDLLTLTSLFVTNYYQQMTIAVMVAVFIPIYVSVLT
ncbi:hypothetical protein [Carboxylicivirga sp. N1Y90]|uniref:hypothetical protein n=1 Tax=Carboxylicivirga fragile TaxID=3417571 RepID=UPI003D34116F|nr:hypothetical protein [Marinilabiliaceae bacterium N1Y90]